CATAAEARALLVKVVPTWAAADEPLAALVHGVRQPRRALGFAGHPGGPVARPEDPTLLAPQGASASRSSYLGAVPSEVIVDVDSAVAVRASPPSSPPSRPPSSPAVTTLL